MTAERVFRRKTPRDRATTSPASADTDAAPGRTKGAGPRALTRDELVAFAEDLGGEAGPETSAQAAEGPSARKTTAATPTPATARTGSSDSAPATRFRRKPRPERTQPLDAALGEGTNANLKAQDAHPADEAGTKTQGTLTSDAAEDVLAKDETDANPAPQPASRSEAPPPAGNTAWSRLAPVMIDGGVLDRNRIITATRYDPAHSAFDVLRTRLLHAVTERGWSRIAITSPTKGCGKTFTAANLAISLARQENCQTILFDTDLRNPSLAQTFGVSAPGAIAKMLRGSVPPEKHLLRLGPNAFHAGANLAFAFNDAPEPYASELLQDPLTAKNLRRIETQFMPKVMLFDMPPALYGDDVLAMRPLVDAVILVVGGGLTTANEIRDVENRLGTETPLLGVVLNRAEGSKAREYSY